MNGYDEFKDDDEMWNFINSHTRIDAERIWGYYGPNAHAVFKSDKGDEYYEVVFDKTGEPKYYREISKEEAEKLLELFRRLAEIDKTASHRQD